jgi:protein BCP1
LPPQDKPAISSLIKYLLSKLDSPPSSAFHAQLSALLQNPVEEAAEAKKQHVGLVLSERMVNMPTQIVPPMYRMLQEELQWAVEDVSVPGRKILHAIPLRDSALAD